jgi:hypothetical protein
MIMVSCLCIDVSEAPVVSVNKLDDKRQSVSSEAFLNIRTKDGMPEDD